jgi:hypothetical protein
MSKLKKNRGFLYPIERIFAKLPDTLSAKKRSPGFGESGA